VGSCAKIVCGVRVSPFHDNFGYNDKVNPNGLLSLVRDTLEETVHHSGTVTRYRSPVMAHLRADHPNFANLRNVVHAQYDAPQDVLGGAKSVVAFFLPFAADIVTANAQHYVEVDEKWARAYVETNRLLMRVKEAIKTAVAEVGVQAEGRPPTGCIDPQTITVPWSHESVAVATGLGSLGLHQMVITDAGCAGRFGSIVLDADLPPREPQHKERCRYLYNGTCRACVRLCPVGALHVTGGLNKERCWRRCKTNALRFQAMGEVEVCGKCAVGPCALQSSV